MLPCSPCRHGSSQWTLRLLPSSFYGQDYSLLHLFCFLLCNCISWFALLLSCASPWPEGVAWEDCWECCMTSTPTWGWGLESGEKKSCHGLWFWDWGQGERKGISQAQESVSEVSREPEAARSEWCYSWTLTGIDWNRTGAQRGIWVCRYSSWDENWQCHSSMSKAVIPGLGWWGVAGEGGLFSKCPEPWVQGWGLAFASLFQVPSHCFMRLGKFLSLWVNGGTEEVKLTLGKGSYECWSCNLKGL